MRLEQRAGRPRCDQHGEEQRARVVGAAGIDEREEDDAGGGDEDGAERRQPPEEQRRDGDERHHGERAVRVVRVPPDLRLRRDQHRHHRRVEDVLAGAVEGGVQHIRTVLHAASEPRRPR
jgi:hypothetical protein